MEHRRYPRIDVRYPGSFRGEAGAGRGLVVNLSWAGCAFKSERNPQVGEFLNVEIHLPGEKVPVTAEVGAVRWARGQNFGVDFVQIGIEDKERLRRLVKTPKLVRWVKHLMSGGPEPRPF